MVKMQEKIAELIDKKYLQQFTDVRNIGLLVFLLMTLAIAWSGAGTIQSNFELQKKVNQLQAQNEVQSLDNYNLKLQNKFLETDQYLELSARRQFGKALPGEKVYIVPKDIALKYASTKVQTKPVGGDRSDKVNASNLSAWQNFLLGHNRSGN